MPKYLIEGSYTAEGLRGLMKDKASGRKAEVEKLLANAGGKLEGLYYALGHADVFVLVDLPSAASVAAVAVAVNASGLNKEPEPLRC
jgi:uncharacterized protein with GYD domain